VICFPNPNPPPDDFCVIETTEVLDSTFFWKSTGKGEDRVAVIWSNVDDPTWDDAAFDLLFRQDGFEPNLPADLEMDVWLWGASSSDPSGTAIQICGQQPIQLSRFIRFGTSMSSVSVKRAGSPIGPYLYRASLL
jgi:hypothetical protein